MIAPTPSARPCDRARASQPSSVYSSLDTLHLFSPLPTPPPSLPPPDAKSTRPSERPPSHRPPPPSHRPPTSSHLPHSPPRRPQMAGARTPFSQPGPDEFNQVPKRFSQFIIDQQNPYTAQKLDNLSLTSPSFASDLELSEMAYTPYTAGALDPGSTSPARAPYSPHHPHPAPAPHPPRASRDISDSMESQATIFSTRGGQAAPTHRRRLFRRPTRTVSVVDRSSVASSRLSRRGAIRFKRGSWAYRVWLRVKKALGVFRMRSRVASSPRPRGSVRSSGGAPRTLQRKHRASPKNPQVVQALRRGLSISVPQTNPGLGGGTMRVAQLDDGIKAAAGATAPGAGAGAGAGADTPGAGAMPGAGAGAPLEAEGRMRHLSNYIDQQQVSYSKLRARDREFDRKQFREMSSDHSAQVSVPEPARSAHAHHKPIKPPVVSGFVAKEPPKPKGSGRSLEEPRTLAPKKQRTSPRVPQKPVAPSAGETPKEVSLHLTRDGTTVHKPRMSEKEEDKKKREKKEEKEKEGKEKGEKMGKAKGVAAGGVAGSAIAALARAYRDPSGGAAAGPGASRDVPTGGQGSAPGPQGTSSGRSFKGPQGSSKGPQTSSHATSSHATSSHQATSRTRTSLPHSDPPSPLAQLETQAEDGPGLHPLLAEEINVESAQMVDLWRAYLQAVVTNRIRLRQEVNEFRDYLESRASAPQFDELASSRQSSAKPDVISVYSAESTATLDSQSKQFAAQHNRRSMLGEMLEYSSDDEGSVVSDAPSAATEQAGGLSRNYGTVVVRRRGSAAESAASVATYPQRSPVSPSKSPMRRSPARRNLCVAE
ncbi:hypothetical protein DICA1_F10264 [Diutina catenulata]